MNIHGRKPLPLKAEGSELLYLNLLWFITSVGIALCHSIKFYWPAERRAVSHRFHAGIAIFLITYVCQHRIRSGRDNGMFLQQKVCRLLLLYCETVNASIVYFLGVSRHKSSAGASSPRSLAPCFARS